MMQYYQLSTDYEKAHILLSQSQGRWLVANMGENPVSIHLLSIEGIGLFVDDVFQFEVNTYSDFLKYCERLNPKFLLPIADPAITLRDTLENAIKDRENLKHSLKSALNESDFANARIKDLQALIEEKNKAIADLQTDLDNAKNELTVANAVIEELQSRDSKLGTDLIDEMNNTAQMDDMIEALEMRVLALTHENEKLKGVNANLRQNYINALSCDDEPDQDYKDEIVLVMQRITTALGLKWVCTDYDPADYEKKIVEAIEGLQAENEVYKILASLFDLQSSTQL